MKKCPNGHEVTDNVKYCPTCGAEIVSGNKFCTKCGSERMGTEKFCSQCGTPFDAEYGINHIFNDEKDSSIKKYLPYIIGAVVLLGIIGVFASRSLYGSDNSKSVVADSMAVNNNAQKVESDAVISDYDERLIYQGEYEFDAVLTDATLEKKNSTFTIKIDGNKVSVPMDEGKVMSGHIYSDDLGIDVVYDYGDDLHWISLTIKPNDKEGKEWVGEYAFTGMRFDAVLKLKECKRKGDAVKVTESRTEEESMSVEDDNQPQDKFTRIAQNGNVAWVIRSTGQMAFFYPKDNSYGQVDFLIFNGSDIIMSSGSTSYTISNNHISFSYNTDVWGKTFYMSFAGNIENDGDKVKIVGQYSASNTNIQEVTFDQVRPNVRDPFKE